MFLSASYCESVFMILYHCAFIKLIKVKSLCLYVIVPHHTSIYNLLFLDLYYIDLLLKIH